MSTKYQRGTGVGVVWAGCVGLRVCSSCVSGVVKSGLKPQGCGLQQDLLAGKMHYARLGLHVVLQSTLCSSSTS